MKADVPESPGPHERFPGETSPVDTGIRTMRRVDRKEARDLEGAMRPKADRPYEGKGPGGIPPVAATTPKSPGMRMPIPTAAPKRRKQSSDWKRVKPGEAIGLAVAVLFVALVHSLPHAPGDPASAKEAPMGLAKRSVTLVEDPYPYPVHVDEYVHMAVANRVVVEGEIQGPFAAEEVGGQLFSLRGHMHERGFQMGAAQWSMLTGTSLASIFAWGPALWAGVMAVMMWAVVRPAPGALASAFLVAALPTDLLFMGAGFLVPIAFGLAWVLATFFVALKCEGGARIAAIILVITGGFFIHMVAGLACIVAALCAVMALERRLSARLAIAATALLPLLWLGPAVQDEAKRELVRMWDFPVAAYIFVSAGLLFLALAGLGVLAALQGKRKGHPIATAGAMFLVASLALVVVSLLSGHTSAAGYYRATQPLFLGLALMAGIGAGFAGEMLGRVPSLAGLLRGTNAGQTAGRDKVGNRIAAVATGGIVALALLAGVSSHLSEPYYRIHDEESWQAGEDFRKTGAGPEDVFLSEPWRAMAFSGMTGAIPHAVLYPGKPPVNGEDWIHYLSTSGADAAWLEARQIDYVVAPVAPNAPHEKLAPNVYRLTQ